METNFKFRINIDLTDIKCLFDDPDIYKNDIIVAETVEDFVYHFHWFKFKFEYEVKLVRREEEGEAWSTLKSAIESVYEKLV